MSRSNPHRVPFFSADRSTAEPEGSNDDNEEYVDGAERIGSQMGDSMISQIERPSTLARRALGFPLASNLYWANTANKHVTPEETALMLKRLQRNEDQNILRKYRGGKECPEIDESAIALKIRLVFMPGGDKPQVNSLEQSNMSRKTPDQKDSMWRVNTAGSLLSLFKVSGDLSIISSDITGQVANSARNRLKRQRPLSRSDEVMLRSKNRDAVTIDSEEVVIVEELTSNSGESDMIVL